MNVAKKTFDVLYPKISHKRTEIWEKADIYCPRCAERACWVNNDDCVDYYVGGPYICIHCKASFFLPGGVTGASREQDEQRLAHLRDCS